MAADVAPRRTTILAQLAAADRPRVQKQRARLWQLNNHNTIQLLGTGGAFINFLGDATLKGGGNFFLSDTSNNSVRGFDTLTNVDNLIAGAGTIETDIINEKTIEATSGGKQACPGV
jgi:hypothetical protein